MKSALFIFTLLGGVFGVVLLTLIFLRFLLISPKSPIAERYLQAEEAVIIESHENGRVVRVLPIEKTAFEYVEVIGGCAHDFEGLCLNVRSGPGEEFEVVKQLRNGVVLKVNGLVERDGRSWLRVVFDEWLRYPERVQGDWYVAADYVDILIDERNPNLASTAKASEKRIIVDRSEQMLYAYEGDALFMQTSISTGVELTPTPRGTFTIFKKTPSRYMQGPIPGITNKYYDLPGVPWNLYFTYEGAVIHGTYWHKNFGKPSSNGCVNLEPDDAEKLYAWADVGMKVIVRD